MDMGVRDRLRVNLRQVRDTIQRACDNAGRSTDDVTLVAVTKYVDLSITAAVAEAGCLDLGESRPQQLCTKAEALADGPSAIRWHLVGNLQRNKAKRIAGTASWIHSVDGSRLLADLERHAADERRSLTLLLQVNISGESAKQGLAPDDVEPLLEQAARHQFARVRGLMGMASLTGGRDQAQRDFERLRTLRDRLAANVPDGVTLNELSMGMSNDFDIAIANGATLVRIGSSLFEGIVPN